MTKKLKRYEIDRGGKKPSLHVLAIECECGRSLDLWGKGTSLCGCGRKYNPIGDQINDEA